MSTIIQPGSLSVVESTIRKCAFSMVPRKQIQDQVSQDEPKRRSFTATVKILDGTIDDLVEGVESSDLLKAGNVVIRVYMSKMRI